MRLQAVNIKAVMAQVELQRPELKRAVAVAVDSSAVAVGVVRSQVVPYKTAAVVVDLVTSMPLASPYLKLLTAKMELDVKRFLVEAQALSTSLALDLAAGLITQVQQAMV